MNTNYSIINPTMAQATRNADGTYTRTVATRGAAPSHSYTTLADYKAHEAHGFISIVRVSEPSAYGFVAVTYEVL